MMFLEFHWMVGVWKPRIGSTFTDIAGYRSFESLADADFVLASCKLKRGKKTDSRTYAIEVQP